MYSHNSKSFPNLPLSILVWQTRELPFTLVPRSFKNYGDNLRCRQTMLKGKVEGITLVRIICGGFLVNLNRDQCFSMMQSPDPGREA
jgi:hypothetical protein